jgi:hypothetical protein
MNSITVERDHLVTIHSFAQTVYQVEDDRELRSGSKKLQFPTCEGVLVFSEGALQQLEAASATFG